MNVPFDLQPHDDSDLLDLVEDLAENRQWKCVREDDSFLTLTVPGQNGINYDICMEWQDEFASLLFACSLPLEITEGLYESAARTLEQINQNLWLGHFDLSNKNKYPTFRYTFIFRLIPSGIAAEMIADVVDVAVAECNRFYSTFQMLQAGDVRLQENLSAAVFETVGEA
jgi:hypothetical protein